MGGGLPRKTLTRAIRAAPGLLALASLAAGEAPQPRPNPPDASAAIPPGLPPGEPPARPGPNRPLSSGALAPAGSPLIPGERIDPIDLPSALRLPGTRDLDIAIAKERVHQSFAELEQARVLWLPSLYLGPNWIRHDGEAQLVNGPVQTISKSSLFLGATAAGGSSVTGPVPAGGPAQVSGLTSILRISDAVFEPLAARQVVAARQAGIQVATNDALLSVAEAYFDLQVAAGRLAIAREATTNAESLVNLTASYARTGAGLDADYRRALTERDRRRKEVEAAVGELEVASAEVVRLIRLDPRIVFAPVEPPESIIRLVPDNCPLDELIPLALHNRPELAEAQALVQATLVRLKQARLRPLIPSLAFTYSGGGFGGGPNSFFGNFNGRSDASVSLFWEAQNLGFADLAISRQRAAQQRTSTLELVKLQDRVASEVVGSDKALLAAARQIQEASRALPEALSSLSLNLTNIRRGAGLQGATRPIEVLQPIQALAQARSDYLDAVMAYNRAQFRLFRALGQPPLPSPTLRPPASIPGAAAAPLP